MNIFFFLNVGLHSSYSNKLNTALSNPSASQLQFSLVYGPQFICRVTKTVIYPYKGKLKWNYLTLLHFSKWNEILNFQYSHLISLILFCLKHILHHLSWLQISLPYVILFVLPDTVNKDDRRELYIYIYINSSKYF